MYAFWVVARVDVREAARVDECPQTETCMPKLPMLMQERQFYSL